MDSVALFWIALGLATLGAGVDVVREVRTLPEGLLRPRVTSAVWVTAALVAVRVAQAFLVLVLALALVAPLLGADVVTNVGSTGAVTLNGDGSLVVRGEAGYMADGLCSGGGARGGVGADELCGDPDKLQEAVGRGVRVDQVVVQRAVNDPPPAATALFALGLVGVLAMLTALHAIGQMLRRTRAGQPFSREGVRSLRVIAAVFVIAGVVIPLVSHILVAGTVERYLGEGARVVGQTGGWLWPSLIALVLVALSEIWRSGIRLQADAEGVV